MATPSPASKLNCTQCGGELHPDEGQIFVTCPYCSATVYLDKTQVVFHWSVAPTLSAEQAAAALARWMSGSQTVKDLDQKSRVTGQSFTYFPLWYFQVRQASGQEVVLLQPGAATSVTELKNLQLPAGDLQPYNPALEAQSSEPTVPLPAARDWALQNRADTAVQTAALVHVPIYIFKYVFQNQTYTAVVEAATGRVLANLFPSKPEAPYLLAAGLTAGVYLCLAALALTDSSMTGLAFIVGLIAAPILFAFAVWVANKV